MAKDLEERVEEIAEAERELERLRMDRVAYEEQESRQKWLHDQANALNYATKKGIEEGMQKGENKKSIEVAKKMLDKGMNITEISEITDLSIEEINNLLNDQQKSVTYFVMFFYT